MLSMRHRVFQKLGNEDCDYCDCLELFTYTDEECDDGYHVNDFPGRDFIAYITQKYNGFLNSWCLNLSIYGTWFDRTYVDVLQLDSEYDEEAELPRLTEVKTPDGGVLRVCAWTYPSGFGEIRMTRLAYFWIFPNREKARKNNLKNVDNLF